MKKVWAKLNEEFAGIRYGEALILLTTALIFIIIGSVADWSIANAVYHPDNPFGTLFAYIGPYPAYVLFGATGVLFFINWQGEGQQDSKVLAIICACIFPILAGALYGYETLNDGITNKYLAALVGIVAVGVGDVGFYFLARHADKDEAYQAGVTFLFAAATVIVLTYLLKKAGLRPRFYWVEQQSNPADYFRAWWEFDASVKENYVAANPTATGYDTYFESWPSGHAALAGFTVLSVLLAKLNPKLKNKTTLLLTISLVWTILVSAARVSDGHHYVSDVAFGAFFGTLFAMLVAYLVYLPAPSEDETNGEEKAGGQEAKPLSLAGKRFEKSQPQKRSYSPKHSLR
jgi:membrane-associated phospholipid phosphatase